MYTVRASSATNGRSSPASARVAATARAGSTPPAPPACALAHRGSAPDRAPAGNARSCARVAPRTFAPAISRRKWAAASPARACPAGAGSKYQWVRTLTQTLPSTTGKLVSASSNSSAGKGSRCSRSIRRASPTVCGLPVIRRCSSARQAATSTWFSSSKLPTRGTGTCRKWLRRRHHAICAEHSRTT